MNRDHPNQVTHPRQTVPTGRTIELVTIATDLDAGDYAPLHGWERHPVDGREQPVQAAKTAAT